MDGWMDGGMDGWIDGLMGRWMDVNVVEYYALMNENGKMRPVQTSMNGGGG
jgi:hypothetical protein